MELAEIEESLGKFADAEHYFKCANDWDRVQVRAAELRDNEEEARRYRAEQATALMNLASLYCDFGETADAAACADQAQDLFGKSAQTVAEKAPLDAAWVAISREDYKQAERILNEFNQNAVSEYARWWGIYSTAELAYIKGEYPKAKSLLEQLEGQLASTTLPPTPEISESVQVLLAKVDAQQGNYDEAQKRLLKVLPGLEKRIPNSARTKLAEQALKAIKAHDRLMISNTLPAEVLEESRTERMRRLHEATRTAPSTVPANSVAITSMTIEPLDKVVLYQDLVAHFRHNAQVARSRLDLANANVDLADALSSVQSETAAIPLYKEAIDIFESEKAYPIRYLRAVSQYALAHKTDEDTIQLMDKARPRVKIASPSDKLVLADFWQARSGLNDCETYEDRAKYLKRAFEIRRDELGLDNAITASAMMQLGAWTHGPRGDALCKRAATILSDRYVAAVKDYGPLGQQATDAFNDCAKLHISGFVAIYPYELAMRQLVYGDEDGATTTALLAEARSLTDANGPEQKQQPYVLILGLVLVFVCGFGELFVFVQTQDAKNSERPAFTVHKKWLMAKSAMSLTCAALVGWGLVQIFSLPSDDNWKEKKQFAYASKAVDALRKQAPGSEDLARASLQLANYCSDDQKGRKKECLLTATKIFETTMNERVEDTSTFADAYKELAVILRDEDREEEAKAMDDKAFQLSRAEDRDGATEDTVPKK